MVVERGVYLAYMMKAYFTYTLLEDDMGMPGIWELVIIFFIVLLIFGAGKIPRLAKDIAGGIREFKKGISGEEETDNKKQLP